MIPAWLTPSIMRWAGVGILLAILTGEFAMLKIQRDSARNDATMERLKAGQLESAYLTLAESVKRQNAEIHALEKATAEAKEQGRKAGRQATATGIKADARILNLTHYRRQGSDCEGTARLLLDYQEGRL